MILLKEITIDGEKIEAKSQVNELFVKELGFLPLNSRAEFDLMLD